MQLTKYCLGFLFDDKQNVALILKQRPQWQKDRLNGIGGKVEEGETALEAMRREFREEAGVDVSSWEHFATLEGQAWHVFVFRAFDNKALEAASAQTDEPIIKVDSKVVAYFASIISNLQWLIPLARNSADIQLPVVIKYQS